MATHSVKFVDEHSSNSKKQHIHLVYEKYVILAMRISSRNQKYLKNCKFRIFSLKNCQEMWVVGMCDLYINFSHTHSYTKYTVIR
jgi:hypothetical protein